jgi:mono/diheme cytochrome c family protein
MTETQANFRSSARARLDRNQGAHEPGGRSFRALPERRVLRAVAIFAALLVAACATTPSVDAAGPAWRGRELAARNCAGCHDVNRDGVSLFAPAPAFRRMTLEAPASLQDFAADVRRHHPDGMPQILLSEAQAADLFAYIRALQSDDPKARLPDVPPCFVRRC